MSSFGGGGRYAQVALTYARRRPFAVIAVVVNVWLLRLRSMSMSVLALFLTGLVPLFIAIMMNGGHGGAGVTLPLAAGLLALGAVVILDAYGRWRRTDLE